MRPDPRLGLYGIGTVVFRAAANFAWFAVFLRFARRSIGPWDSLAVNGYGIYIPHYAVVIWMQFALLVFSLALLVSWGITIVPRRAPAVARII